MTFYIYIYETVFKRSLRHVLLLVMMHSYPSHGHIFLNEGSINRTLHTLLVNRVAIDQSVTECPGDIAIPANLHNNIILYSCYT